VRKRKARLARDSVHHRIPFISLFFVVSLSPRFVTFLTAAGRPGIDEELKKGAAIGEKTYKVHLDGYNQLDYLTGTQRRGRREGGREGGWQPGRAQLRPRFLI